LRAQSTFEYIVLVAIVMLFIVSGVGIIFNYSQRQNEDVKTATIERIGVDIIDTAEKVYYIGGDSWQTIRVNIPDNVKGMYVLNNNELVIRYESYNGISESIFYSDVNMTTPFVSGSVSNISSEFHPGLNSIRIFSLGSIVSLEEVK
jgi:hypothetical protein